MLKLYILPGLLLGLVLGLTALLLRSRELERRPVLFAQATVIEVGEGRATFRLFDGQLLDLKLGRDTVLQVGDYGRLTYRAGRFLGLE